MGALVQSRAFGYTMGAYGAGRSIYQNFLTRGHEVVFPEKHRHGRRDWHTRGGRGRRNAVA